MKNILNDPKNLRYNLNTIIPVLVFLTCILSALITCRSHDFLSHDLFWIFGVSFFSAFCAFLVVFAITRPVNDLARKVEKIVKFEKAGKEKGDMIEIYHLIERLTELLELKNDKNGDLEKNIIEDIERLEYIVPLGYLSLTVAHEVRNPLNTITGMSELLKGKIQDGQASLYVEAILKAANKIDVFTKELLDFTDNEIFNENFNINELIEDSIKTLGMRFQNVRCDFKINNPVNFKGDKNKIYQSLHNILKNAFEYEQDNGHINVEIKLIDKLYISIQNKHSMIDKEDMKSIFKPFFSKKKGGRGLGLFISMKNIRLHKGDIEVESNEEGTTFTIELPMERQRVRSLDE